jgi:hypothetical protein
MSRIESITVAPSTSPKAAPGRFEAALQGAASTLAASVVGAVELAAPAVPFGTVLAGAVRGAAGGGNSPLPAGGLTARLAAGAPSGGALGALGAAVTGGSAGGGGGVAGAVAGAAGGGTQGDLIEATRALQQEAQAMNLQYLQLQEQMQRESREFTALSNVMRVKHDSARAAIANIH